MTTKEIPREVLIELCEARIAWLDSDPKAKDDDRAIKRLHAADDAFRAAKAAAEKPLRTRAEVGREFMSHVRSGHGMPASGAVTLNIDCDVGLMVDLLTEYLNAKDDPESQPAPSESPRGLAEEERQEFNYLRRFQARALHVIQSEDYDAMQACVAIAEYHDERRGSEQAQPRDTSGATWRTGTRNPHTLYRNDEPAGFLLHPEHAKELIR